MSLKERPMLTSRAKIGVLLVLAVFVFGILGGCQREKPENVEVSDPDFSNARYIAELATLECYSHNVVRMSDEGGPIFDQGKRKLWTEYSGIVRIGIDASKVKVASPDDNGIVVVQIPEAEILGEPDVDESSFVDIAASQAIFTEDYSIEERQEAFAEAQDEMVEKLANDDRLLDLAQTRAKKLLEEYIVTAGDVIEETYTVKFENIESASPESSD